MRDMKRGGAVRGPAVVASWDGNRSMAGKSKAFFGVVVGLGIGLSLCSPLPAIAQSIDEKAQVCAGCQGEKGKPIDKTIPIIWGQQQGYLYIQLRDFKRNDRKNEIMQPIGSSMERQDMMDIAEYFSKK